MTARVVGGRYRLDARVDVGADVYRATDLRSGAEVAIKLLPSMDAPAALRREASIAMRARHPNLVSLLDAGVDGADVYLVSSFVPGIEMRTRLVDYGPMGVRRALDVAAQLFSALDALHRRGAAHGDVKPDNVLFDGGQVRVFDYGVARLLHEPAGAPGWHAGTPEYMHPRLFAGAAPDARTDCFAAWVTTYELLAGRRPYGIAALRAGNDPLPAPASVGDTALDAVLVAGLQGVLPDARAAWLAVMRFLRGRTDLPVPPPVYTLPGALIARLEARPEASLCVVGPSEHGRVALEAHHARVVERGGSALWIEADAGNPGEPLSAALAATVSTVDKLDDPSRAAARQALGPARDALASAAPALRLWLGAPERRAAPPTSELRSALVTLFRVFPRPLRVLADGLDRMDAESRRFVLGLAGEPGCSVVATRERYGGPELAEVYTLPAQPRAAVATDRLSAPDAELLARARVLGLAFGPRLARACAVAPERLFDAALEAEAAGLARWDGAQLVPRAGPRPPPERARTWFREAAERLDLVDDALLVARYALLGDHRARLDEVPALLRAEAERLGC